MKLIWVVMICIEVVIMVFTGALLGVRLVENGIEYGFVIGVLSGGAAASIIAVAARALWQELERWR